MILVIFYSRTGNTRKVAQEIAKQLNCPIEEIFDTKDRSGVRGYISAGRDATLKNLTELKPIKHNPAEYDMIIAGTPVWGWGVSTPIRTYLENNKKDFKNMAFFCTMGGSGGDRAFKQMEEICGTKPLATLALLAKEITGNGLAKKIIDFTGRIKNSNT